MGLSNSLYASISGLNTMGNAMSVLGDNVANVNTIAFKSSRATFQDVLSQSLATASGSAQVGRGVTLSTVNGLFAQGSFESTSIATDLAIGGQGFFMLRAADSAQADMYTRAGEFRFDQEGNLVNPIGHFVQGWTIDSTTGEIQGTIGDINLGKSTPPVATTAIDVIVNVDSRETNEVNEIRLFDAWNGTNKALANPTDPIDTNNYEYTSAIKIFDSKGASHDITIYFDRTTVDNQWEFLVTCAPEEDLRRLTTAEQVVYAPDTTYNYEVHKGAGALMYGVIDYNTSGAIKNIYAWDVPPDGEVDPALNTNRIVLDPADNYYSFDSNFTGADTDQAITLNFGARYSGLSTSQTQILVSNNGAFSNLGQTNYITKETSWSSVFDSAGNQIEDGDVFYFSGYRNDGTAVSGQYVVDTSQKVQNLLDAIDTTFGASSSIDAFGRIRITDNTGGESGMYVTSFTTSSVNDADPFGGGSTVTSNWAYTPAGAIADATGTAITTPTTLLTAIGDGAGNLVTVGDTFLFTGTAIDGTGLGAGLTYTVAVGSTIQDLMDFMEDAYTNGVIDGAPGAYTTSTSISTELDASGRIRIYDRTNSGNFATISCVFSDVDVSGFDDPFGGTGGANILSVQDALSGQVDITTSKRTVTSPGRALTTNTGSPPVITAATIWNSVYSSAGSGPVGVGDTITVSGTKGDGTAVAATVYTVTSATDTVQDLLDFLETTFDADASIDGAGRLVLRDRSADSSSYTSALAVQIDSYGGAGPMPAIFGTAATAFAAIAGDTTEDGSRMGDVISASFETEALSSTQYANSSTTIFQDQDGFAAGFLQSVSVDTDGVITGNYSNGQVLKKAQVALASFNNLAGLRKEGGNIFRETTDSGAPVTGAPGTNGLGSIAPNSLEQSNVDLGTEFVKLITTQRGFQANSKIITTTDEMLADLINIKR